MTPRKQRDAIEQIEWMRNLLAFLLVGSFVGTLTILLFLPLATENEQLVTYMLGQISGMATTALGFYFVSKVGQDALDAKRTENTGKAFEAVTAAATGAAAAIEVPPDAQAAADQVAAAATDEADRIAASPRPNPDGDVR